MLYTVTGRSKSALVAMHRGGSLGGTSYFDNTELSPHNSWAAKTPAWQCCTQKALHPSLTLRHATVLT